MDIRNLNTFIQTAELNSFSRAGERLGYSQPTVSIQIKQLEQEVGVKLFDRIGNAVRLTEEGRRMLSYAQKICHMCQEMVQEREKQEDIRGEIRIAMADSLCSPLISRGLSKFREQYPNISLCVTTAGTTELFRLLDQNEVDMVCTLDSHICNTKYVTVNEEKIGVHFVVSSSDQLAKEENIQKNELIGKNFLLTEKGMSYRRLLDEWMAQDSMEIRPILEVSSADLICGMVEKGMGMSFLPDYVTEEAVRRGTIVRMKVHGFEPELWKQLLYHRDKWVSRPMQAVITHFAGILLNN